MKKFKVLLMGAVTLLTAAFMQTTDAKAATDADYLTFTALEDNSNVTFCYCQGNDVKYCINDGEWEDYDPGSAIALDIGDKVSFKGRNVITDSSNHFYMQGSISASGSVTSLLDENGSDSKVTMEDSQFSYMFYECEALEKAPLLPSETLANYCYESMFEGCISLKAAPLLPAEELAEMCYYGMFINCISLETAPILPAKELALYCYFAMFNNCTSLKEAPILPAETLAPYCYQDMFNGCTSLETVPLLPAKTLANYCYRRMYKGCKRLPVSTKKFAEPNESIELVLPDTLEYSGCFEEMFLDAGIDNPLVAEDARVSSTPEPGTYYLGIPMYSINVCSCEHGRISVDSSAKAGDTVAISVIPDTGYLYRNLTVLNKTTSESVSVTDNKFVMPSSDVLVNVEFYTEYIPKFEDPTVIFTDVAKGKWYSKTDGPIAYVVAYGIMNGTGDGTTFDPEGDCTREMFVQIFYNMEGKPGAGHSNPFKDVKSGKWYYDAVTWALANDVTKGTSADTFGIDVKVTREQLAQFLMNYAKKRGYDTSARADISKFPDNAKVSGWAKEAILWANANGIVNGKAKKGANYLDPKGNATRAEVAQMIMNFQKKFGR